jgi:hypothetical protein
MPALKSELYPISTPLKLGLLKLGLSLCGPASLIAGYVLTKGANGEKGTGSVFLAILHLPIINIGLNVSPGSSTCSSNYSGFSLIIFSIIFS